MKDVAVLGVGMYPFGTYYDGSNGDMARQAGMAALKDAGISFRDVQAAYVGHIFAQVMTGVRVMKEFGLTGIPVQRIENASATGSACFREACDVTESALMSSAVRPPTGRAAAARARSIGIGSASGQPQLDV